MKKRLSLILAGLLLCSTAVSCSDNESPKSDNVRNDDQISTESNGNDSESESNNEPVLPDSDFNGEEFLFLAHGDDADYNEKWIDSDSMDGEIVNDAVYERNRDAEEKFNCVISVTYQKLVNSHVVKTVMAGDTPYFAIWGQKCDMSSGVQKGVYLDLNLLPYCQFSAEYWDKNCIDEMSIIGRLYMAASDISMMNLDCGPRYLYFNKKMLEDYQLKSPYDYVDENNWTLDAFLPMVSAVSEDLNGDGIMNREDKFGMLTEDGDGNGNILYFLVGAGICSTINDSEGKPYLGFYSDKTQTVIDKVASVLKNPDICIEYNKCAKGADYSQFNHLYDYCRSLFASGHFLFVQNGCDASVQFVDMVDDYGIVPNPKYDSAQENYYHRTDPFSTLLALPMTNTDLERSGILLEWMSWKSNKTVLPAYYETTMKLKRQRDETAMRMLDIVKNSIYYDISDIYDLGVSTVIWQAYTKEDLASVYAKNESKLQNNIEKMLNNLIGE